MRVHALAFIFTILNPIIALASSASSPDPWPAGASVEISGSTTDAITDNLVDVALGFEPSDMLWHEGLNQFVLVGDDGDVCTMDADGSTMPSGDFQTIALDYEKKGFWQIIAAQCPQEWQQIRSYVLLMFKHISTSEDRYANFMFLSYKDEKEAFLLEMKTIFQL